MIAYFGLALFPLPLSEHVCARGKNAIWHHRVDALAEVNVLLLLLLQLLWLL